MNQPRLLSSREDALRLDAIDAEEKATTKGQGHPKQEETWTESMARKYSGWYAARKFVPEQAQNPYSMRAEAVPFCPVALEAIPERAAFSLDPLPARGDFDRNH